jgi:hypothetical protein
VALAIDASTPAAKGSTTSVTSLASNSFSPPGGALLLVMFANAERASGATSITDSLGTHLTYTKKISEAANSCAAEIWIADVPATAPGSMTVTANFTSSLDVSIDIAVITGAKPVASQTGATTVNTGASGAPSATIASLIGANSLIVGRVSNFTNATGPTIPAGQSDVFNGLTFLFTDATNGSANWAQYLTGMNLAAAAPATINDTAPSVAHSMCVAEILAASSGTSFTASTADTSATTDAVSRVTALPRSAADVSASSDAATGTSAFPRASTDTSASSSASSRALALQRASTDTSASSATSTRVAALARASSDTSACSDVVTASTAGHFTRSASDTSATTTTTTRVEHLPRASTDTSVSASSLARAAAHPRASTDTSLSTNATSRVDRLIRSTADTSLSSDAVGHGAVPQPPRITPPTVANITAYHSLATVVKYSSAAAVFDPSPNADIPTAFSGAALVAYHSAAGIVAYITRSSITTTTSTARIGPTLG